MEIFPERKIIFLEREQLFLSSYVGVGKKGKKIILIILIVTLITRIGRLALILMERSLNSLSNGGDVFFFCDLFAHY